MGTVAAEPSGNDTSLVVVESPLSDGEVVARWSQSGLASEIIASEQGLRLIAISGFVQEDDPRIREHFSGLSGLIGHCPRL